MPQCKVCGGTMEGDGWHEPYTCENFQPHPDLCPEPDSGPWYCNTDGFTKFETCDGCELPSHPDKLLACPVTESDGNQDYYRLCENCRTNPNCSTNPKKGTP